MLIGIISSLFVRDLPERFHPYLTGLLVIRDKSILAFYKIRYINQRID
jgi:hypothetical protein